jgi:hypothetical protein
MNLRCPQNDKLFIFPRDDEHLHQFNSARSAAALSIAAIFDVGTSAIEQSIALWSHVLRAFDSFSLCRHGDDYASCRTRCDRWSLLSNRESPMELVPTHPCRGHRRQCHYSAIASVQIHFPQADFWPGTTSGFPVIVRNTDNHLQLRTR